ncbi:MAG: envelope stress response membrane protein PspB [Sphingomonadales bacterium]|nr:envelope stress response membrane protein PspB [Sphingomonadales bacterium]MDE2170516.1 envelope stress response membrane protein PspB [Sphingomonadales bacterium]
MDEIVIPVVAIGSLFVGLPWIILHYMTKWKTASTLTNSDEALLEELYQLARRLSDRMGTVERLVSSEHPDFQPASSLSSRATDHHDLDRHTPTGELTEGLDRLRSQFERTRR